MGLEDTLLVADSHPDCRETLAMALEFSGYSVCTAGSHHAALTWLRHRTPRDRAIAANTPLDGLWIKPLELGELVRQLSLSLATAPAADA